MEKVLYTLGIIAVGLVTGYSYQILVNKRVLRARRSIADLTKLLQKIAILILNPIATMGAIWVVDLRHPEIIALPFVGGAALFFGGILAFFYAILRKLSPQQTGAFIVCGAFTNMGAIGALICYTFLGEPGFALVPFYKLFEAFLNYGIGFPLAKSFSDHRGAEESGLSKIKNVVMDPFVLVTLVSIVFGFALNLSGFLRPKFYSTFNAFIIPVISLLLLFSIGLSMEFKKMRRYLRLGLSMAAIKFICVPPLAVGLGALLGLGRFYMGIPLKVVLILSAMPTGFTALVPPTIYDLDLDLANTCWFMTTVSLVWVAPVLYLLLQ